MWGQQWNTIAEIANPYPEKGLLDVTDEMIRQVGFLVEDLCLAYYKCNSALYRKKCVSLSLELPLREDICKT